MALKITYQCQVPLEPHALQLVNSVIYTLLLPAGFFATRRVAGRLAAGRFTTIAFNSLPRSIKGCPHNLPRPKHSTSENTNFPASALYIYIIFICKSANMLPGSEHMQKSMSHQRISTLPRRFGALFGAETPRIESSAMCDSPPGAVACCATGRGPRAYSLAKALKPEHHRFQAGNGPFLSRERPIMDGKPMKITSTEAKWGL